MSIHSFVDRVLAEGASHYRDLPWRRTRDPYAVLVSEVMLQQTQVARVITYHERWMDTFPNLDSLAGAPLSLVLEQWQGLGYNRRAVALKRLAEQLARDAQEQGTGPARLPEEEAELRALPGIGPATASGVRAFAFDLPGVYLETNVRAVVLHEMFSDAVGVPDREIVPLLREALDEALSRGVSPRQWTFALLDYGAQLKRTLPNPSRRSAHHTRQSTFEGSRRQKRAVLLRAVMASPGVRAHELARDPGQRYGIDAATAEAVLQELERDGFIRSTDGCWSVTD